MPNVCVSELTITGPKKELDRFLTAAKGNPAPAWDEYGQPFSLQTLFPIPAHLDTDQPVSFDERNENWYTWCKENWGTKWDVMSTYAYERVSEKEVFVCFDTAWLPPIEAFTKRIAPDYPALTFTLRFEEPNIGISGECQWQGGRITREEAIPFALGWGNMDEEEKTSVTMST